MRNLSKTVDRILKYEPALESQLLPIKEKWNKGPKKYIYWTQLLKILNKEITPDHPQRDNIQNIISNKRKVIVHKSYTFEEPSKFETVVGIIPEFLEDRVRRNDRLQIEYAKLTLEAKMTHNNELTADVLRKCEKLDIEQKKVWVDIKDYFKLWSVEVPTSFFIRTKGSLLALTSIRLPQDQREQSDGMPDSYIIRMNNEMIKRFLKFFNPPPGFFPNSESE